ncbi:MAG: alkaline phosphatase family protein [Victivallaceae bacterium]|nr:alkaline phosphatase family protein [Victivallaceae bacterium]
MSDSIHVFIYLTGPGWHILKEHGFLTKYCKHQFPVQSQLGCSHSALSTTLTGKLPNEHGHFSSYYFKKSTTVLETAQRFYYKFVGKKSGYSGKYSVPLRNLNCFVQSNHHAKDLAPGCFSPLISIVDLVHEKKLAHSIINTATGSPIQALKNLRHRLKDKSVNFAFIQIDEMDNLLHHYPHDFQKIDKKLRRYERQIKKIISVGNASSSKFNLTVLSGHGMTFAPQTINIKKKINSLGITYGYDYHAVYDPTMALFWYKTKSVKSIILDKLYEFRHCKVLSAKEKKDFGINFSDRRYGETIALVEPGFQISPNDILSKPLPGMHGYNPDHPDSLGACISTQSISPSPSHVKDFFNIMANFVAEH